MLFFGRCIEGQGGVSLSDENVAASRKVEFFFERDVVRVICSYKQSFLVTCRGEAFSCGSNDFSELGRSGKRSIFNRIDAIETFNISEISSGDGFCIILTNEGKVIAWGKNDMGQLGSNDRESREKPRPINFSEKLLQISSGAQHSIAITTSGNVLTWGANRKGQLGDGQLTSSCSPLAVAQFKNRSIIQVCCGENHTLAITVTGNLYVWGDNSHGQLGLGDEVTRLRPELMRSMRSTRVKAISAGKQHSTIMSFSGFVFVFGSNAFGQCAKSLDIKNLSSPVIVEKLRDFEALDVCCGAAHTMVLCSSKIWNKNKVYGFGLNSSGQLGLGHSNSICTPTELVFPPDFNPGSIRSGPISYHTFVCDVNILIQHPTLPSVNLDSLSILSERLIKASRDHIETVNAKESEKIVKSFENKEASILQTFREHIAAAFSSVSVLNASFQNPSNLAYNSSKLSIDLKQVRSAYERIFATQNEKLISTLGRSTLQLADKLKECPFDDAENLSVFLIVLENPLLLKPVLFQVVLERVITGILALPKLYRIHLFSWLKNYESEYFARVLQVMQSFLVYILSNKLSVGDPVPVVLVLQSLYECNKDSKIVPDDMFYNNCFLDKNNMIKEWERFKTLEKSSSVFNYFSYPFLLNNIIKAEIVKYETNLITSNQINFHFNNYFSNAVRSSELEVPPYRNIPSRVAYFIPDPEPGVPVHRIPLPEKIWFQLIIRRDFLLEDAFTQIIAAFKDDPGTLKLPLRVTFDGEIALDHGGVSKEFFLLIILKLIDERVLTKCGTDSRYIWFNKNPPDFKIETHSLHFFIGIIVGLALHNSILINFSIPPSIYKKLTHSKLELLDLWSVDQQLANGLKSILSLDEGLSIEEVFGSTFEVSENPLIDSFLASHSQVNNSSLNREDSVDSEILEESMLKNSLNDFYERKEKKMRMEFNLSEERLKTIRSKYIFIELIPGGASKLVDRGNRAEFVELFVQHTLYTSVKDMVDEFIKGLSFFMKNLVFEMFTHHEIDYLISGSPDFGDFINLRKKTEYKGIFNDDHCIVNWFWNIISSFNINQQRKFLRFVTGSDRVPIGGLEFISLTIQSNSSSSSSIPVSHTCFNILELSSAYDSEELLRDKMFIALENCQGFGLI